ncbi:nuclear transport factor 2 family protein [Falsiroseomonas tokyonensis]|uniref:Nuclear transport factor 2 family protein n=1 Tax=Falsiroseomonas tokyonensis TaxID=430521 RepID=A0ABV7BRH4_9PROT|nr:nuclear transport factor 2 family protein [Falsiroseomonas tokyonensis]MBU8537246.1 nuclear transport factor 2 family protein [Falsiroseomonas tokyonensis]
MTYDALRIRQELEMLNIAFWRDVDSNWGREAHEHFTEDGVYTTSHKARVGREAIRGFYAEREGRGERVARHLIHNFHVIVRDADHATAEWTMCLYAEDGVAPLMSEPPILIGAVTDECVRGADGRWRYASRTTRPLFKGSRPTSG